AGPAALSFSRTEIQQRQEAAATRPSSAKAQQRRGPAATRLSSAKDQQGRGPADRKGTPGRIPASPSCGRLLGPGGVVPQDREDREVRLPGAQRLSTAYCAWSSVNWSPYSEDSWSRIASGDIAISSW